MELKTTSVSQSIAQMQTVQCRSVLKMIRLMVGKKKFKAVLALALAVSLIVFVFGYHKAGTAQNTGPQISLNSPVSFPGDI